MQRSEHFISQFPSSSSMTSPFFLQSPPSLTCLFGSPTHSTPPWLTCGERSLKGPAVLSSSGWLMASREIKDYRTPVRPKQTNRVKRMMNEPCELPSKSTLSLFILAPRAGLWSSFSPRRPVGNLSFSLNVNLVIYTQSSPPRGGNLYLFQDDRKAHRTAGTSDGLAS